MNTYRYNSDGRQRQIQADGYTTDSWGDGRLYFYLLGDDGKRETIATVDRGEWKEVRKLPSADIDIDMIYELAAVLAESLKRQAETGSADWDTTARDVLAAGWHR